MRLQLPRITEPRIKASARTLVCWFLPLLLLKKKKKSSNACPPTAPFKPKIIMLYWQAKEIFILESLSPVFWVIHEGKGHENAIFLTFFFFKFLSFWNSLPSECSLGPVRWLSRRRCWSRSSRGPQGRVRELTSASRSLTSTHAPWLRWTWTFLHTKTHKSINKWKKSYFTKK